MATAGEIAEAHLGEDLAHHCAICRGEYCACCDVLLPAAKSPKRGLRLCAKCWPDAETPMHPLHISLQWDSEGWTLCICNSTADDPGPKVGCWFLLYDRAECLAILDRYLCRQRDRAEFDALGDHAGHTTIGIFVTPRRLAALAEATRRDPRTGYEKSRIRATSLHSLGRARAHTV